MDGSCYSCWLSWALHPWSRVSVIAAVPVALLTLWGSPLRKFGHVPEGSTMTQLLPEEQLVSSGGPPTLGPFPLGPLPALGAWSLGYRPSSGHRGCVHRSIAGNWRLACTSGPLLHPPQNTKGQVLSVGAPGGPSHCDPGHMAPCSIQIGNLKLASIEKSQVTIRLPAHF